MNSIHRSQTLRNIVVPASLVADCSAFGGTMVGDCLRGDLRIIDGHAASIQPCDHEAAPNGMVLPRLVEAHCHLDKCFTVGRIDAPVTSLQDAISKQAQDKRNWTEADLRQRMRRGLAELDRAGVGLARSHIDWHRDEPPLAWSLLVEAAIDLAPAISVQPAALTDIAVMADLGSAARIARTVRDACGALGTFVYGQRQRRDGLRSMFRMAEEYGLPLDFHVDEGMDASLDGVEMIADIALETRHTGPILCGHACALSTFDPDDRARVVDKLARAGIVVAVLPSTNLFLQDRDHRPAARRGLAPIAEMLEHGVQVTVGVDNVCDAFCPVGRHDPLWSLSLAILAAQLSGPLACFLPMITTSAARALGHAPISVDGAATGDLIFVDAPDTLSLGGSAPMPRRTLSQLQLEVSQ